MRQEATGGISGKDVMKLKTAEITEPYQKNGEALKRMWDLGKF